VDAPVGAVDDRVLPVGDLVDEPDGDHPADDRRCAPAALEHSKLRPAPLDAGLLEGALHHPVGVGALAEMPELGLQAGIERPHARAALLRQAEPPQRLETAGLHGLVRRRQLARAACDKDAVLRPRHQRMVQAGEALQLDLARELLQPLQIALRAELQHHERLGTGAHTMTDVVARDDKIPPMVVAAADHDVRVRVAGVEVVDRHPVELRVEILLHLPHQIADERFEVLEATAVLRRDDEAELVWVALRAFEEGVAVGLVASGVVELPRSPVAGDAVALDVAQVGLGRTEVTADLPGVARAHDDPAAAGRHDAGAREQPRRRAAPTCVASDVAALPHDAGTGPSGLREHPPRRGEVGAPSAVADATLFRLKRPIGHCTPPEKHPLGMKVFLLGGMSICAIQIVIYQRLMELFAQTIMAMRNSTQTISMTYMLSRAVLLSRYSFS
jgi:hypothetical protein